MQTVSDAWKSAQLQNLVPESFVEISYRITDPNAESDASGTDNGHVEFSDTSQIVDEVDNIYEKYATLEHNVWTLDGTFPILPVQVTQSTGFVSSVLSGEDCTFSTPPVVTISFTQVHENAIPGLTLQWSEAFGQYATDFSITAYNGTSVVASTTVTGNTQTTQFVSLDISNYNKIEVQVNRWCLPCCRARIEQITLGAIKVFGKSMLMGYEHTQSSSLLSMELPKAEIIFDINNVTEEWNPDNPQGVYKYLIERQEISVRYGFKLNGNIEWISAGVFFMSGWETPQNGITAKFTARDVLEFMNNPFVATTGTYTLAALAQQAFEQSDLPLLSDGSLRWQIDSSLESISVTIPTNEDGEVAFEYTCAEVVQLCANACCCVLYQDRTGIVHVEPLSTTLTDYIINGFVSYQNAEYEISKELKSVSVNNDLGTVANATVGEVQTMENPLLQNATAANTVAEWVRSVLSNRKTLSGEYRADPRLDVLDKITVSNKYATNSVYISEVKYTYNGAFRGSYEGRVME